jgi:hypothetical protein
MQLHAEQWQELEDDLLLHESRAPAICSPLSILPPDEQGGNPFESVRYLNGPVAAAWQMLHTAFFILTICTPCSHGSRPSMLSSLEVTQRAQIYACQVVANSLANRCPIAWANAVQLLALAGQCLVVKMEREACVNILREIQKQTGWNTRASINRLDRAWECSWTDESGGSRLEAGQIDAGKLLYRIWLGDGEV